MNPRWHILADDLTGAADTLAGIGCSEASIHLARPPRVDNEPVSVVCTATRDCDADELARALAGSASWLAKADVPYKKVDSLLRGNTFAEVANLLSAGTRLKGAVFSPAFPAQGRFTRGDRHWTAPPGRPDGQPRKDICTTMVRAFGEFGVAAKAVRSLVEPCDAQVVIPDAVTDADLAAIALSLSDPRYRDHLWCGSAAMASALAAGFGPDDREAGAATRAGATPHHAVPVITSSRHPALREQLARLRTVADAPALFDLSPTQDLPPAEARRELRFQAERLVARVPQPHTVAVVGGDTLLALCEATGASELVSASSLRRGWGCLRLVGGRWDGVICHTRSGAFGDSNDLVELLDSIGDE